MLLFSLALATVPGVLGDTTLLGDHAMHDVVFGPGATPTYPIPMVLPPVTNGPDVTVYGYLAYWDDDLMEVPWDELSHLAVFSANVDTAGNLSSTNNWDQAAAAVAMGAPYGVEVHLCITNFVTSELETLLGSPTARANLIANLVAWQNSTGAAGINVDFEGMPVSRRAQMVQFITDLDAAVGDVVIATPAVDWGGAWDYGALTDHADLFIMGYGYHWSGSSEAGPTDPLHSGVGTVWAGERALDWSIDDYLAEGADPDRVILGLPLYGRRYATSNNSVPSPSLGDGGAVFWSDAMDDLGVYSSTFEPGAKSVYYHDGTHQHWVNDVDSMRERIQYAVGSGIGGIGFWALNYDNEDTALWTMVHEETTTAAPPPPTPPPPPPPTVVPPTPPPVPPTTPPDPDPPAPPPTPPGPAPFVAHAGDPILAYTGDTVVLNGSRSTGPVGLQYRWSQSSGPAVELDATDIVQPRFTVPAPGNYTFLLEVGDGSDFSAPATSHVVGIDRASSRSVKQGCGCSGTPGSVLWLGALLLPLLRRRS